MVVLLVLHYLCHKLTCTVHFAELIKCPKGIRHCTVHSRTQKSLELIIDEFLLGEFACFHVHKVKDVVWYLHLYLISFGQMT